MAFFSLITILLFFLLILADSTVTKQTHFLKLPLLHKSSFSPSTDFLTANINRVKNHHRRQKILKSPLISGASTGSGQYFVTLNIGTPPQPLLLIADTGSDLIWVKCSACQTNCSKTHSKNSSFFARKSTSFSPHHCYDPHCNLISHPTHNKCNQTRLHSPCRYDYAYADGSRTAGFFSKETVSINDIDGTVTHYNDLSFGCGFDISGPSVSGQSFNGAKGVMGLGRGPISFSSQLGLKFDDKFSYCLRDYTISPPPTSFLFIGGTQNITRYRYTPLLSSPLSPTFYYIGIKYVYVNGVKLKIRRSVWVVDKWGNGGTVIDSGTTLTFLAVPAYNTILKEFKRQLKVPRSNELTPGFDLCVNATNADTLSLPKLSFKLDGGAVFSPPWTNYFIQTEESLMCLAIRPVDTETGFSILGNLMQQGFLFEFDKDRSRLGFSRHGCALP